MNEARKARAAALLDYAAKDLDTARKLVAVDGWPAAVAFHSQQAAEKAFQGRRGRKWSTAGPL